MPRSESFDVLRRAARVRVCQLQTAGQARAQTGRRQGLAEASQSSEAQLAQLFTVHRGFSLRIAGLAAGRALRALAPRYNTSFLPELKKT